MSHRAPYLLLWLRTPAHAQYADARPQWASARSCYKLLNTLATQGISVQGPTPAFAFDIDGVLKRGSQVRHV